MTIPNQNQNVNHDTQAHHKGGEGEGGEMVVRYRKKHKGELKVLCTREKRTHRARTVWCTARTALTSPS